MALWGVHFTESTLENFTSSEIVLPLLQREWPGRLTCYESQISILLATLSHLGQSESSVD